MDLLDCSMMKTQKSSYTFRNVTKVLRVLELCLVLVLLLWAFNKLPFAFKISGDFLRYLAGVISSPLFVFLLCNVIIATLVAKSWKFSGDETVVTELYEEFMKNTPRPLPKFSHETLEEVVFQDKEIILEPAAIVPTRQGTEKYSASESNTDWEVKNPKVYRRTKSEKLKVTKKKILRRSDTEKLPARFGDGENLSPKDELSDEDFQRTVDEFIKKQRIFLKQESFVDNQCFVAEIQ